MTNIESLYFIAIVPPEDIEKRITELKKEIYCKYNSKAALRSPAHITLHMPFKWKESKEIILENKLEDHFKESPEFMVQLNGFGAFVPRVIYINVIENFSLSELQQRLMKFSRSSLNLFNGNYKEKPFHPHITIAFRDLKKNLFFDAFNEYEEKVFQESFMVSHITLLKHTGKEWAIKKQLKLN